MNQPPVTASSSSSSAAAAAAVYCPSALSLQHPIEIRGDWEYIWYDTALNISILMNNNYFYFLNFNEINPTPKLFFHHNEKNLKKIIFGKISLDYELLALQINLTTIIIIEIKTKKNYEIFIKNYHQQNYILPFGFLWSNHGGNSQDLIIITSIGIECYKISILRGQCKLSRILNHFISFFWYEPINRIILISTIKKLGISSTPYSKQTIINKMGTKLKEILLMDGYFLKTEKSGMPMLELPPPDKIPHFELGPGVKYEDISLMTLYGNALCLVRYLDTSINKDFITIYHLTKQKVERIHYLSLGMTITGGIRFSSIDNLLLCHCLQMTVSLIYDLQSPPVKTGSGSAMEIILPLMEGFPIYFAHKIVNEKGEGESNIKETGNDETSLNDGADVAAAAADWDTPVVSPEETSRLFEWRMRSGSNAVADLSSFDSLAFLGKLSEPSASSPVSSRGRGFSRGYGADDSMRLSTTSNCGSINNSTNLHEILDEPEAANVVYNCSDRNGGVYEFLGSCWILDTSENIAWKIECDNSIIMKSITDVRMRMYFLARRGMRCRPIKDHDIKRRIEYQHVSLLGRKAKHLLLNSVYEALLCQYPYSKLEDMFGSLMRPYINEFKRLTGYSLDDDGVSGLNLSNTQHSSGMQQQPSPTQPNSRTSSYSEGFFGKGGFKLGRLSINAVNTFSLTSSINSAVRSAQNEMDGVNNAGQEESFVTDALCFMDGEPLEPVDCMQMFQPDISMVGVRVRKMQLMSGKFSGKTDLKSKNNSRYRSTTEVNSDDNKTYRITPTCQSTPLTTRRDKSGYLVTTQSELLSHVWLPLVLNSDIDAEFCSNALLSFVLLLRENEIPLLEPLATLLMNILFHGQRYTELSHFLRMGFLPDGTEIALTALEFVDMLYDHNRNALLQQSEENSDCNICEVTGRKEGARAILQQFALDMLFRLEEYILIAKWYLNHGMVLTAIDVCRNNDRKRPGLWKHGLFPGCIAAVDFFQCAIRSLENSFQLFQEFVTDVSNNITNSVKSSNDSAIDANGTQNEEEDPFLIEQLRNRRIRLQEEHAEIMHTVYMFIRDWDGAALSTNFNNGQSKLAASIPFPTHLFTDRGAANLMFLFGYA